MPEIKVVKPFSFLNDSGQLREFQPGTHEVDESTANSWFVKAHLEGAAEPQPKPGTAEYAAKQRAAASTARSELEQAQRRLEEAEAAAKAADGAQEQQAYADANTTPTAADGDETAATDVGAGRDGAEAVPTLTGKVQPAPTPEVAETTGESEGARKALNKRSK